MFGLENRKDEPEDILYIIGAAIIAGILTFFMRQTIINVSRYIEFDLKNEVLDKW